MQKFQEVIRKPWLRPLVLWLPIFLTVFVIHSRSPVITSFDSMWSIFIAKSVVSQGDLLLDEYASLAKKRGNYGLRIHAKHLYSYFPTGTALLVSPFVALFEQWPEFWIRLLPGFPRADTPISTIPEEASTGTPAERYYLRLERTLGSMLVAIASVLIFELAAGSTNIPIALLCALSFAFGTSAWSIGSRGLWQHGPVMMLLAMALLFIQSKKSWLRGLSGLPLGFAYLVRPTNSIPIILFGLYFLIRERKILPIYVASAAASLLPFIVANYLFFDAMLPPYYRANRLSIGWFTIDALAANLFSPSRGLFIFSPFLLLAIAEILRRAKARSMSSVDLIVAVAMGTHWIAVSCFENWWGGHTYGPRYMSDVVPYCYWFLPIALQRLWQARNYFAESLVGAALCWSIFVHRHGAMDFYAWRWNVYPINIDYRPDRVWSLDDPQFLRTAQRL